MDNPSFVRYVYVLYSLKDRQLYVGFTKDLRQRLNDHQAGKNIATKFRLPLQLIYYEAFSNKQDAVEREKYLKSGHGKRFLRKQLHHTLNDMPG